MKRYVSMNYVYNQPIFPTLWRFYNHNDWSGESTFFVAPLFLWPHYFLWPPLFFVALIIFCGPFYFLWPHYFLWPPLFFAQSVHQTQKADPLHRQLVWYLKVNSIFFQSEHVILQMRNMEKLVIFVFSFELLYSRCTC